MQQIGIYEQLITDLISQHLQHDRFYVGERELSAAEASLWLSRFLSNVLEYAFESIPHSNNRLKEQIDFANQLLFWLKDQLQDEDILHENLLDSRGRILTALYDLDNPVAADLKQYVEDIFPLTGLTQSELFCGSNAGLSLESELKREILSADSIYWLVSFIKWAGIRIFRHELEEFARSGRKIKIITTSYMGATDAKAVEFLASLPNAEVKLSYNTKRERLHAKSYLFLRDTGFHTGYIGSSNLSHSALTSGLEWNLKITSQEIPHIIKKSISTFDTYWESSEFERFDGQAESKDRLRNALRSERGNSADNTGYFFDIKPYSHQKEILEELRVERSLHQRYRNLVVAATGTGKTLISAFDFSRYLQKKPDATFLFVAHREEILVQARNAFRGVLRNSQFGELWVGNHSPSHYRQLFASVQTLNNQLNGLRLSEDFYDYIVIDEVHHIAAASYRAMVQHFTPQILLGLTATPERHDGSDILQDFGGVIAAEIRLPEAINRRQLCPFQYFGIDDDTDLRTISWARGRYDVAQLTNLYTHNHQRVRKIIQSLQEIVTDVTQMKALAFCVSREHAEFMATQFLLHGITSDYLTSDNSHERQQKQQAIRSGAINVLCVVDIFNEGVDIPEIDTLLFLRPTESLTIFLQQLGRGLRLANNKDACTVLDFVGNSRPEYDFSNKFRALIGRTNNPITREIQQGFPHAPLGCRIELSKQTQAMVLTNIRKATLNTQRLISLIRRFSHDSQLPLTLANFLHINPNITLADIYKRGSWTELKQRALSSKVEENPVHDLFRRYARAINNRLLATDAHHYLAFIKHLAEQGMRDINATPEPLLTMLHYDFWQVSGPDLGFASLRYSIQQLAHPELTQELVEVTSLLMNQVKHEQLPMPGFEKVPLHLHARYAREQILAAFGTSTFARQRPAREGVLFIESLNVELLFVTLNKDEQRFSPTTMYHDYAISERLFHWQSQNSSRPESGKGLSYIQHQQNGKRIVLFVREQAKDADGRTLGFVNFGEVEFVSSTDAKPMNITWRLKTPMPAFMWQASAKLAMG